MRKICFATTNRHKLDEVATMLEGKIELVGLDDVGCHTELAEDFMTLEANSNQKAEFVFQNYHVPCFADDSGLEVEALNGAPGVLSARYAGPQRSNADNIELLLKNLTGLSNLKAQFRTVVTFIDGSGKSTQFEGVLKGEILFSPRGNAGFGYDPIFLPWGYNKTLAEMTIDEKNKISHRALAIRELVNYLSAHP